MLAQSELLGQIPNLARRAEKVDNTVHLQILNARFAKEVRAMLAEGLTMDQVGQELGMSSGGDFRAF
jgi:hypothetical protein